MKIDRILFIIALLLIIWFMIKYFILNDTLNANAETKDRFIMIETYPYYEIYYDKQTKVEYIMRKTGHGGSSYTVLVDKEGKPLLYNNN